MEKGVSHYDVFAKVYFNSTSKTWKIMDVALSENIVRTNSGGRLTLTGHISFNRTINGYPITEIDPTAMYTAGSFKKTAFTGKFYGKYLTSIPHNAFANSVFTDELSLPNVESIGTAAFATSKFSGELSLPNVERIFSSAFSASKFTGSVNLPKVILIDSYAFKESVFTGDLYVPKALSINPNAFTSSEFTGKLTGDSLAKVFDSGVGSKANFSSQYTPNLTTIGANNGNLKQSN